MFGREIGKQEIIEIQLDKNQHENIKQIISNQNFSKPDRKSFENISLTRRWFLTNWTFWKRQGKFQAQDQILNGFQQKTKTNELQTQNTLLINNQ